MEFFLWLISYTFVTVALVIIFRFCWKLAFEKRPIARQPAPELNERWKCSHPDLIDVESVGEIVAYICVTCNAQVDVEDPAATRHRNRVRVEKGYADMAQDLAVLHVIVDEKGRQTEEQARRFAALTQRHDEAAKRASELKRQTLKVKRSPKMKYGGTNKDFWL